MKYLSYLIDVPKYLDEKIPGCWEWGGNKDRFEILVRGVSHDFLYRVIQPELLRIAKDVFKKPERGYITVDISKRYTDKKFEYHIHALIRIPQPWTSGTSTTNWYVGIDDTTSASTGGYIDYQTVWRRWNKP